MKTLGLQKKSFKFIKNNLYVTFDKLPQELRTYWMVDDPVEFLNSDHEEKPEYTVFIYALVEFHRRKRLRKFEMQISQLQDYFITFQTLLSFAEINEKTDVKIKPIKLFDFDNYNNLKAEFGIKDILQ